MQRYHVITIIIGLLVFLSGCQGQEGEPARRVARNAVGQLVSYEQYVEQKITSAAEFYEGSREDFIANNRDARVDPQRTQVNTQASIAADSILKSPSLPTAEDVRAYAERVMQDYTARRDRQDEQLRRLKTEYLQKLAMLELDRESLKAVRKSVEQLQVDLSEAERFKRAMDTATRIKESYDQATADQDASGDAGDDIVDEDAGASE